MKKKILVVDDERKIVTVLKGYLEQAGFHIVTAGDGQMALATFRHAQPDLIELPSGSFGSTPIATVNCGLLSWRRNWPIITRSKRVGRGSPRCCRVPAG